MINLFSIKKILFLFLVVLFININAQWNSFKGDAQVECGSFYAGLEFHHTCPMIQRVSFYYPSANSLDQSTDYWKRDSSFVMAAAVKTGDEVLWLNKEQFAVDYRTYMAEFIRSYNKYDISVKYEFLKDQPAFAVTYTIKNKADKREFQFYTDLEASLRTSHTYNLITDAVSATDNSIQYINYNNPETRSTSLFCINAGEKPFTYTLNSPLTKLPAGNSEWWKPFDFTPGNSNGKPQGKSFRYIYKKQLAKGETMQIIQVYGTAKINERKDKAETIAKTFTKEIKAFEDYALNGKENHFSTGDKWIDNTVKRSEQILAVNRHYIDNSIQPMPCPAEYNFYFTHDVLLTDLAAVNFDLQRVKNDLNFIASHSREDSVIPHAYYWKDSAFVTEYADPDNWNHFWFIIASSKYLLHSGDTGLIRKLFPLISKSMNLSLTSRKGDLMYAKRPDWWDIGSNYGARSYTTTLAIKALREFVYISSSLKRPLNELKYYSQTAKALQDALNSTLWNDKAKFLINKMNDDSIDHHYYIGSLIANHFNVLNDIRKKELVKTASQKLLDRNLGIYNAFPMDFHKYIDYYKFLGDEAGAEFYYMNGGIWPHGNAWFALALISAGQKDTALQFMKNIMTIDGILHSPNGQPAMYEVRIPDYKHPKNYGKIDKPQFMWSAGWYLYTLYNLFGTKEEEWNITLNPWKGKLNSNISFDLTALNNLYRVTVKGKGEGIKSIRQGNKELYTLVLPKDMGAAKNIEIQLGQITHPYIKSANCSISEVNFDSGARILQFNTSSFESKTSKIVLFSPKKPVKITQNGSTLIPEITATGSGYETIIQLIQISQDLIKVAF